MFAVSPWAVIFSRKIWAQNLLPLFVMLWVIGLALALVDRKPRFIWLALVALALAVQIHLAALALVPATLILLVVFWRRLSWRAARWRWRPGRREVRRRGAASRSPPGSLPRPEAPH